MKINEVFLVCDCYSHALSMEYDKEFNQLNLSIWERGFNPTKLRWRDRLRLIYKILFTGQIWHDYVCLDKEKAAQLAEYINRNTK